MDDELAQYIHFRETSDATLARLSDEEDKLLHARQGGTDAYREICRRIGAEYVWNKWVRSHISRMDYYGPPPGWTGYDSTLGDDPAYLDA
jgi:hypothetical protein